jgi:adenine-specific DNA-methyltransferase
MAEIVFKGKEYVYNHHLTVPYRPLLADVARGIGPADLASNLIIHGDNLHALKSLLPRYAGKVDLVFIDPPYNTGNEGWCYNDNVNSPIMKEWLSTNPVDGEDMLRHDKWLCMMWPRLVMLRELLSDDGAIWITLDDNEAHRASLVLDEIFGADNFVAQIEWQKRYTRSNNTNNITSVIDHLIVYQKSDLFAMKLTERDEEADARYSNPDNDARGPWKAIPFTNPATVEQRPNLAYTIRNPNTGEESTPKPREKAWRNERAAYERYVAENRFWWGNDGRSRLPSIKRFLSEVKQGMAPINFWNHEFAGNTDDASLELRNIFGDKVFDTPKPTALIERVLEHGADKDALVLDSFAGSGTTAHAVLKANAKDNGNRKFILVEGEDYADKLTAERVRRAIKGYAWVGNQRETLLEEKINFTQFKKADEWLKKVEAIKVKEGFSEESAQMELSSVRAEPVEASPSPVRLAQDRPGSGRTGAAQVGPSTSSGRTAVKKRFDKINVELKDGMLRVEGEKRVSEMAEGLGGEFTYCTLGEPLDIEKLLSGESLPAFEALGAWLFHTATGGTLLPKPKDAPPWYLGEAKDAHVWLVYEPALMFLKSPEAALTLSRAKTFAAWGHARNDGKGDGKRHLVFAPAKYLSNKQLLEHGVDYAPLPFALYREG